MYVNLVNNKGKKGDDSSHDNESNDVLEGEDNDGDKDEDVVEGEEVVAEATNKNNTEDEANEETKEEDENEDEEDESFSGTESDESDDVLVPDDWIFPSYFIVIPPLPH